MGQVVKVIRQSTLLPFLVFHRPRVRARYRRWWIHHLRGRTGREHHPVRPGSACRGLRHGTDPGAAAQNECFVRRKLVFQQSSNPEKELLS